MRRMGIGIGTAVLTLLAAAFTLCPAALWLAARQENARAVERLEAQMSALDAQQRKMRENVAKWYNLTFRQQDLSDVYPAGLDFGGTMGAVEIPDLGLYLPISVGGDGVTHDDATALPIGGNTSALLGLGDLSGLTQGDYVYLHILGEVHVYQVGAQGSDCLVLYGKNRTGQALSVVCARTDGAPEAAERIAPATAVKAALAAALGTGIILGMGRILLRKAGKIRKNLIFRQKMVP